MKKFSIHKMPDGTWTVKRGSMVLASGLDENAAHAYVQACVEDERNWAQ